jgi:hypothetical protein
MVLLFQVGNPLLLDLGIDLNFYSAFLGALMRVLLSGVRVIVDSEDLPT